MRIVVTGAGGAIGGHLVGRLVKDGHEVTAIDVKPTNEWWQESRCLAAVMDLRYVYHLPPCDVVYHLAADMGGLGFLGDSKNDYNVMVNNSMIDINVFTAAEKAGAKRVVYASSACVYNEDKQNSGASRNMREYGLVEEDAYPAMPDLEYGWQKLFSERMLRAVGMRGVYLPLAVRFHNVYGPHGAWTGGREKAPAAICRKVAEAKRDGKHEIEVWGNGEAVRSYLYVDDCVEGLIRLEESGHATPINLGSDRGVTVNELAGIVSQAAQWPVTLKHVDGPRGVASRNADLTLLEETLDGWRPPTSLEDGIAKTYAWIEGEVMRG